MATKVLIGIQARSGSSRLPKKGMELISGQTIMDRVLTACVAAARFLDRGDVSTVVSVLIPAGDELALALQRSEVMEGPEDDVLARYRMAAEKYQADYIVRITGDCPLLPSYVVSQMVKIALGHRFDYCSNVDERFRTAFDGSDCEVFSKRLLEDTHLRAKLASDREHVTTLMRSDPPPWAKVGFVGSYLDFSGMKLSVDTPDDLDRVRQVYDSAYEKYQKACLAFGKQNVIRQ